jgi:hypothetical protein
MPAFLVVALGVGALRCPWADHRVLLWQLQAMLSVGAALLGSPAVLGVDVDPDALEVAASNCDQFEGHLPVCWHW